jgi:hypothetical protein
MKTNGETVALEKLLRPLTQHLTAELARALISLRADAETQARYDTLADRNSEGRLTVQEQEELASIVRANTLLGLLKAEAQSVLAHAKPA